MPLKIEIKISNNVRELIQSENYEKIICNIMNLSKVIFPNDFHQNKEQSHGECDFMDEKNEQKYEAKILFKNEQCQLIANSDTENNLKKFFSSLIKEEDEFNNCFLNNNLKELHETSLFKEMNKRLDRIENDENAILFLPYPMVFDSINNVLTQFGDDILSITYNKIKCHYKEKLQDKRVYIIYPSIENEVIIRELSGSGICREHISTNEFSQYLSYRFSVIK